LAARLKAAVVGVCFLALALPAPAQAAFPGQNGKIVFASTRDDPQPGCFGSGCNAEIYVMNPDGTGVTRMTNDSAFEYSPAWSPDGKQIAFNVNDQIYKMDADGSHSTRLTDGTTQGFGGEPAWSPDGKKIAFGRSGIWVMNADGTGQTEIFPGGSKTGPASPAWSPDGTKIAVMWTQNGEFGPFQIYTMNPDGTGMTIITDTSGFGESDSRPNWSPDGAKLVFSSNQGDRFVRDIFTVNRDGTGAVRLNPGPEYDEYPVWSPDGSRLAFTRGASSSASQLDVYTMNPDGSGLVNLTNHPSRNFDPDWQPTFTYYPRPRGASPTVVFLVPASLQCTAPNSIHGAPLTYGSCSPPSQSSSTLTVGTPDANGPSANAIASVSYKVHPGNPATPANDADMNLTVSITDARKKSDLSDYTGQLQLTSDLRITDRDNTHNPGVPGPGTVQDTTLPATVPCAATGDTGVGATCNLNTTFNALYPGLITEGQRSIWELGQVKVYDGGADGLASTMGDNTLFMDQGIFIP
jgi:Tol biopolymer transport system component